MFTTILLRGALASIPTLAVAVIIAISGVGKASASGDGWVLLGQPPVPLVITSSETAAVHQSATQTLTFTFGGPVTGFDVSDVTVSGADKVTFAAVSSSTFTLVITSPGGMIAVSVVADAASPISPIYVGTGAATFSNFYQDIWIINLPGSVPLELLRIPAGTFTMGSPSGELSRTADEPQHTVTLSQDFYLGKTEVTQAQWLAIRGSWPAEGPNSLNGLGDNFPAFNVSHDDIQTFMSDLNTVITEPGAFSLPTESQWEYAARAGTTTRFNFGDGLSTDEDCATGGARETNMWYCGNSRSTTNLVGQKPANAWGLRDMHGNVWEWCADWHGPYPGSVTDPAGPVSGSGRTMRGGSWPDVAQSCRSAQRGSLAPAYRFANVGFRVCAVRPVSLVITSNETSSVHQMSAQTLTFTFDQPVTGFDASDVTVTGAAKGTFTPVSSAVYTLDVTGSGGTVSASVAADAAVASAPPNTGNVASAFSNFYQDTWTLNLPDDVPMELIRIAAGTFTMGSPVTELSRFLGEAQHTVTLSQDFYLGKTEVTQAQWLAIRGSWPAEGPNSLNGLGDNFPAYNVSHDEIQTFMSDLNTVITEPGTFSLPTESQWEYAARAGTTTRFNFGDGLSTGEFCTTGGGREANMWYCANASLAQPVGQKLANAWGLRDMHGNVSEWCADWYDTTNPGTVTNPTGPVSGSDRVFRGGSWENGAANCRSAMRFYGSPGARDNIIGFRVLAVR